MPSVWRGNGRKEILGSPIAVRPLAIALVLLEVWRLRTGKWQHSTVSVKHLFFTLNVAKWNKEWTWWIVPLEFTVTSTHFELGSNSNSSPLHFCPHFLSAEVNRLRSVCISFHLSMHFWDVVVILIIYSNLNVYMTHAEKESYPQ